MEKKTWNMELEVQSKIEELELEKEYWNNLVNHYSEMISNNTYRDDVVRVLFEIAQNLRDLAYFKLEKIKKTYYGN